MTTRPMCPRDHLLRIFDVLNGYFGDLHWWPGETPFEVIVGAILTQNTNWKNVERAIDNLKNCGLFSPAELFDMPEHILAERIKPSGYYRIKAKRLKAFIQFLFDDYNGDIVEMFKEDLWALRGKLLGVKGIGDETADSILLYAGGKPVFVIDAYTRRILERHRMIKNNSGYGEIQTLFMSHLPGDALLFNQYHALLVNTGKDFCRKTPRCEMCPLKEIKVGRIRSREAQREDKRGKRFPEERMSKMRIN